MTAHLDPETPIGGLFEEERSAEIVNARITEHASPRLKEVMSVLTRHLHEAIKEIEPSHDEWFAAIEFLTRTGQMCTDWRQEYILLSDVLGATMLVDAINHRRPKGATPNTILGPFYVANAPHYENGANICKDGKGEPTLVSGRVMDTAGNPIAGATLDIWQTNDDGFYDVQQKGVQPDYNLRGLFTSDANGFYAFRTVKPRHYPIPADGPVGKLLGSLGRHPNRAAHLHFIVTAPGYDQVITHIFTPDCPYLHEDTVFGVKKELIAQFTAETDAAKARRYDLPVPFFAVDWDFVLTSA
ncbi:Protocatechuate 3,4-dioxygenase beta subunit [Pseudomonas amygdali pv. eriobotryae]|uniref:6-chlorohydroxyquinol-1,2-dioxygenase n=1 Tax=Pseudomonas amygdali pv. eriobotryae TaxID=129137 RepID=A0A0P9QDH7_PSEA0|nr:intradiol ring-cleavage dioxygenase [Pseudomonas amygdali]KPX26244.1 Protocatechuate 3,4-dioxygenase beta subunit [Pseudomonas amygdali pv. eriobotryae]KWS74497.1 6-chlorohydroxyquinol-1,2-dioxygenase [Pseudomonas amygdali pv. eriobotryae]PHN40476.1 6-chlorohydroxyquinol-1,2-dioxygenase [Pseudomonas amygdali]RML95597.1 Protocatechuate 3,4-dioxygenase beta subunit [Pseudomonas amygdali pv. eriobotryae]GFZ60645.1 6-chlorohydroxyquinol-1,2-dioxygenase [Pseudomonas amygdali pv. eriobotryae]